MKKEKFVMQNWFIKTCQRIKQATKYRTTSVGLQALLQENKINERVNKTGK